MKTVNQFRFTNKFCITAGHIKNLAMIHDFFNQNGNSLVMVANDDKIDEYTVRYTTSKGGIFDARVRMFPDVFILERVTIFSKSKSA
jgi:hypothetical protein